MIRIERNNKEADQVDHNQVISLKQWSSRKNHMNEERSLSSYLNVLNFHELIDESKFLIQEIEGKKTYCHRLATRSKLLINEFSERVGIESRELSNMITSMSRQIEKRISAMQGLPSKELTEEDDDSEEERFPTNL